MMQQYLRIKAENPDTLVLHHMRDFYALFFDDEIKAAKLLDITRTTRGQSAGTPIKMAGVPFHAINQYLAKLAKRGESATNPRRFASRLAKSAIATLGVTAYHRPHR